MSRHAVASPITCLMLSISLALSVAAAAERPPVRLIFDTDIQGDADDVGTVAVLHALADSGEAEILATGVSSSTQEPRTSSCVTGRNTNTPTWSKRCRLSRWLA